MTAALALLAALSFAPVTDLRLGPASNAAGTTLDFTMPQVNTKGDTLTGTLLWECAVTIQSPTWLAYGDSCLRDTALWARVVREADWRVLASGYALVAAHVTTPAPPVISFYGQRTYWVRACRDTCGGWGNPATRAAP